LELESFLRGVEENQKCLHVCPAFPRFWDPCGISAASLSEGSFGNADNNSNIQAKACCCWIPDTGKITVH